MTSQAKIQKLTRQLYPTGRAFRNPDESDSSKLIQGLAAGESRAYDDMLSTLNALIPDNSGFSSDDATDWERRLGLVSNPAVSFTDRKLAILRKMAHPGEIKARQHYLYLEGQLRAAGFDVYVHENRIPTYPDGYETANPYTLYGSTGWVSQMHGVFLHGEISHGLYYNDMIVNSIDPDVDAAFDVGSNNRSTFFVGGQTMGTFADVDADRRTELRWLILRIKPAQMVGFLFLNYI